MGAGGGAEDRGKAVIGNVLFDQEQRQDGGAEAVDRGLLQGGDAVELQGGGAVSWAGHGWRASGPSRRGGFAVAKAAG